MTAPYTPAYQSHVPTADDEHLRLLTVFHYVLAGLTALFGCFPIIHLTIGILALSGAFHGPPGSSFPDRLFGLIFTIVGAFLILFFWTIAVFIFLAGRNLARRRRYTLCLVAAGIECLFMPLGTALGVFTIIVLLRPSVKLQFGLSTPA